MEQRAVIFDFGGVIVKTRDRAPRFAWDDRLGLARGSIEALVHGSESWMNAQVGALSPADYRAQLAHHLGLSAAEIEQMLADFYSADELDSSVIALIHTLRDQQIPVALLSNFSIDLLDWLQRLKIAELFDPLVISAQIGVMKPAAAAYQAVLDRLKLPAEACFFVDDLPANIEGAQKLGIRGILYQAGMNLEAALLQQWADR